MSSRMDVLGIGSRRGHRRVPIVHLVGPHGRGVDLFATLLPHRPILRPHVRLFATGPRFQTLLDAHRHLPDILRLRRRRNRRLLLVLGPRITGTFDRGVLLKRSIFSAHIIRQSLTVESAKIGMETTAPMFARIAKHKQVNFHKA